MTRHLEKSNFDVMNSATFSILHSEDSLNRQVRVAELKLDYMSDASLRNGMQTYLNGLRWVINRHVIIFCIAMIVAHNAQHTTYNVINIVNSILDYESEKLFQARIRRRSLCHLTTPLLPSWRVLALQVTLTPLKILVFQKKTCNADCMYNVRTTCMIHWCMSQQCRRR